MNKWTAYVPIILELVLCMGVMWAMIFWKWGEAAAKEWL